MSKAGASLKDARTKIYIPELKQNNLQRGHLFLQIREIKVQKLIIILQEQHINV